MDNLAIGLIVLLFFGTIIFLQLRSFPSKSDKGLLQFQYELDSGEVVPVKAHHVKSTYHHVNFLDHNNRLIIAVRGTDIKSFWIDE